MKKKLVVILAVMIVSAILIFISKGILGTASSNSEVKNDAQISQGTNDVKEQQVNEASQKTVTESQPLNTSENNKSSEVVKEPEKKQETATSTETPQQTQNAAQPAVQSKTQEKPNITIVNTISGNVILSKFETFNGETVANITIKVLRENNIPCDPKGFGSSIYFSSINGIKERSDGAASGWCYFINGKKPSVGAGSYKLNKDDVLEWRFLKDGISN